VKIIKTWGLRAVLLLLWWSIPPANLSGQSTATPPDNSIAAVKVQITQLQQQIQAMRQEEQSRAALPAKSGLSELTSQLGSYATLLTTISGFLTLIAGMVWKAFVDARNHKWLMDSRAAEATATITHRTTQMGKLDQMVASSQAAVVVATQKPDVVVNVLPEPPAVKA